MGSEPAPELRLGFVDDRARTGWWFQLFLTPDQEQVVACLGVNKQVPERPVESGPP